MFCCALSLILSPNKAPGQQVAKQQPSPILWDTSQSKIHGQNNPIHTTRKQIGNILFIVRAVKAFLRYSKNDLQQFIKTANTIICVLYRFEILRLHSEHHDDYDRLERIHLREPKRRKGSGNESEIVAKSIGARKVDDTG